MEGVGSVFESEAKIQFEMVWNGSKKFIFFLFTLYLSVFSNDIYILFAKSWIHLYVYLFF